MSGMVRYKSVINEGFALTLGDGLALERERARGFNGSVRADEVERRREAVRQRNRGG
jgi:enoyl-CoA hydratase